MAEPSGEAQVDREPSPGEGGGAAPEARQTAQDRAIVRFTKVIALATCLPVLVAMIYTYFTYLQWKAVRETLDAMKVSEAPLLVAVPEPFDFGTQPTIRVVVKNHGRTDASSAEAIGAIRWGERLDPSLGYARSFKTFPSVLAAGEAAPIEVEVEHIPQDVVASIRARKSMRFGVFVLISNYDKFGQYHRHNPCFLWAGPASGRSANPRFGLQAPPVEDRASLARRRSSTLTIFSTSLTD